MINEMLIIHNCINYIKYFHTLYKVLGKKRSVRVVGPPIATIEVLGSNLSSAHGSLIDNSLKNVL